MVLLETYQEGCTGPGKGADGIEVCRRLEYSELLLTDVEYFVEEARLPRVQLQHLQLTQDHSTEFSQIIKMYITNWLRGPDY